jgi:hypothetical protein
MTTIFGVTDPDEVTRTLENVRKYPVTQPHPGRLNLQGTAACGMNISILLTIQRQVVLR